MAIGTFEVGEQPIGFKKATKSRAKLRMALIGTSGCGKTWTSLEIAKEFGGKTALIDTEHGSSEKYADDFDFDILNLKSFHPDNYIAAIKLAEQEGYDNIIIDSLSHAWSGKDGVLQIVDEKTKASRSQNSYIAWGDATPIHNALIEAILASTSNIFVTMRSKTEYTLDDVGGKKVPRKIGMAPIQRDGVEYEFDVILDLTIDNDAIVNKTRCSSLKGKLIHHPGKQIAETLKAWSGSGAPVENKKPHGKVATPPKEEPKPVNALIDRILSAEQFLGENNVKGYMNPKEIQATRKKRFGSPLLDGQGDATLQSYIDILNQIAEPFLAEE